MAQPDPAEVMRLAEQIAQTKFTSLKLEWEQFQRREEAKWTDRLRQKESTRMRELDDAFQNREKDRAAVVSRTQAEYVRLEAKLRKALAEVEARERRLAAAEEKLKQQHAQKLSELQLLQRRLREDSRHQIELEKQHRGEVEERLAHMDESRQRVQRRLEEVEADFDRFRRANRRMPEAEMRAEVARLQGEKADVASRLERERADKNQALLEKEQYRAHVHHLARALKREQEKQSTQARHAVEQLRVEYLAREEKFVLDGDRQELRNIKRELDELRHTSNLQVLSAVAQGRGGTPSSPLEIRDPDALPTRVGALDTTWEEPPQPPTPQTAPPTPLPAPPTPQAQSGELVRLQQTKEELLASGQYNAGDSVIEQLAATIASTEEEKFG